MAQPMAEVSGINMSLVVTRTTAAADDEFIILVLLPDGQQLEMFGRQARALRTALKVMAGETVSPEELAAESGLRIWPEG